MFDENLLLIEKYLINLLNDECTEKKRESKKKDVIVEDDVLSDCEIKEEEEEYEPEYSDEEPEPPKKATVYKNITKPEKKQDVIDSKSKKNNKVSKK